MVSFRVSAGEGARIEAATEGVMTVGAFAREIVLREVYRRDAVLDADDIARHVEAEDAVYKRTSAAMEEFIQGMAEEIIKAAKETP